MLPDRPPLWRSVAATLLAPLQTLPRAGLLTDMDGTLSPIVDDPAAATITPTSRALLATLAERLAVVAVVSGRAAADVQARVGLAGLVYIGNHGLERWSGGAVQLAPEAARYRPALEAALAALPPAPPGVQIEDKGATLAIHYRRAADPTAAAAALRPALAALAAGHGLRLSEGRMVFELRPPVAIDKGTALRTLIGERRLDAAVYLGDDTTDADALRAARRLRQAGTCYAVGLGVLSASTPPAVLETADALLAGVPDVEAFLAWLAEVRQASSS